MAGSGANAVRVYSGSALGPRQAGKTTLAEHIAEERPSVYLDLEDAADREKLADAALYLSGHEDKLVILDEIQRMPELFHPLPAAVADPLI